MKKILFILCLLLGVTSLSAQRLKTYIDEDRRAEVRKTLVLDYSMPDYTTSKPNPKIIGQRLADILDKFQEMSQSQTMMGSISVIQTQQIDGMIYCTVKKVKLNEVAKHGNQITITYDTELARNQKNLKNSKIVFIFVDGVSDDMATNDIFTNVCKYVRD